MTRTRPEPAGPVTLKQVADHAGVSISTASNALTGSRSVSPASVQRVLQSAAALGYRRNEVARTLRTGLRNTVGVIVPDVTNPFWGGMIRTIERQAALAGFHVALTNTEFDATRETSALAGLVSRVDGIVLFSTRPTAATLQPLLDMGIPIVACDEVIDVPGLGGVYSDNVDGARTAAHHLVDSGGTVFGMLEGPEALSTASARRQGFREGLRDAGVPESAVHSVKAEYSFEGGREGIRRLLAAHPDVDAVFASTDNQAIGAMLEVLNAGRAVPDDLLVCGFDDISWSARLSPPLTTVRQDAEGMATAAIGMLLEMVTTGAAPRTEVFPVSLVTRESTQRTLAPSPVTIT
ncbi:LacI family DNA-binding transcriptional regulator [Microbacterium aquimaris]|uniref:LacI family DNA-binding transcriptional regulator n=1 Tax=Microbacterium aquimaris TaxID=459816 RepID=A0ABU5N9T0_9MICO|nr:LacI family DNA-binding transcriptional regulator [Microbacterium aquimaris]MDZ8162838.1 LacI family DNA-binding transcriptional regulator [Microbacterium aquimaris]